MIKVIVKSSITLSSVKYYLRASILIKGFIILVFYCYFC